MRLATHEFIRRFLIHVLPVCFHRIRHYGLLASASRKAHIASVETVQLSGVSFCSDSGMLPLWGEWAKLGGRRVRVRLLERGGAYHGCANCCRDDI